MPSSDCGTTYDKVATTGANNTSHLVPNKNGEIYRAAGVFAKSPKQIISGLEARRLGAVNPGAFAHNIKAKLGTTESVLSNGTLLTAAQALTAKFKAIKEDLVREEKTDVIPVVLSHPVHFRDPEKADLVRAAEEAGLMVEGLVTEPEAAAIAYSLSRRGLCLTVLVVDIGGGTTDVAILRIEDTNMQVLACEGIQSGGNDLSNCIRARILADVADHCGQTPDPGDHALFFYDLEQQIEETKKLLDDSIEVPVPISFDGHQFLITIRQDEFREDARPLIQDWLATIDRACQAAGITTADVDRLLLTGGVARSTYVRGQIASHTKLTPSIDIEPERAVAYGAALLCDSLLRERGRGSYSAGRTIPCTPLSLKRVTPHAIGCAILDRTTGDIINSAVIPKNSGIPCRRTDTFFLEHEEQTSAIVEVLQGESEARRGDCASIGTLELSDLPTEQTRTRRIRVMYAVDRDGMVEATATDLVSGKTSTVSLSCDVNGSAGTPHASGHAASPPATNNNQIVLTSQ